MNILDVVVPIVLFFLGLFVLGSVGTGREDPLEGLNGRTASVVEQLVQTKYFRIIRLNINEECQLGMMKRICKSKSCAVCRCNDKDIPEVWLNTQKVKSHLIDQDLWDNERNNYKSGWVWHVEDEANDRGEYFDIHSNIESFTNYNGSSIWKLIYEENCFQGPDLFDQMCHEEKILYNIISGLHTSITTHLSRFYKHAAEPSLWADLRGTPDDHKFHFNHTEYRRRVLDHPYRIKNLMLLYRVLGKAIATAAPYLMYNLTIQSDEVTEDMQAKGYLIELVKELEGYEISPEEKEAFSFFTRDHPKVKEYQHYIHNISEIMNCVECEKCRVFGKMQTYGIGTALKILLGYPTPYKRNELVALFNVFNKISMSVHTYYQQRQEIIELGYERPNKRILNCYKVIGGLLATLYVWWRYRQEFIQPEYAYKTQ